MVCWKLWKNTHWQKKKELKMIKTLREGNLITEEEADQWRKAVIGQYISIDDANKNS